jgi:hypothetical protein
MDPSKLKVISVISNPVRYQSRYRLYHFFEKQMQDSGVDLYTVELAFGDRPFEVTESGNPNHIQVRSFHELWHKENLINIGLARLPENWEFCAWIDSDVGFARPDWAQETLHQLQHYQFVQLFSHALDLGPQFQPLQTHTGFVYCYHQNETLPPQGAGYGGYLSSPKTFWHPGYAWAARREAIDHVGGMIDWAILGSGDHHMAMAMIGEVRRSMPGNIGLRYLKKMLTWQERCEKHIQRDVGYVPGFLYHFWHGSKKKRYYRERWDIIIKNGFDPDLDLKRDSQGLWQLTERNHRLRDEIRAYMRARDEDGSEI